MAHLTNLKQNNIDKIILNYNILNFIDFIPIYDGIQNSNYIINTKNKKFILTIFEDKYVVSNINYFIKLLLFCRKYDFNCPYPIIDKNKKYINFINSKPICLFSFIEGQSLNYITQQNIKNVGKNLAKLHLITNNYTHRLKTRFDFKFFDSVIKKYKPFFLKHDISLIDIFKNTLNDYKKLNNKGIPKGTIHGDLFPDNVLFNKKNQITGFLDFYFSDYNYLISDIAIVIISWCFYLDNNNNHILDFDKINILLKNYSKIRKIHSNEIDSLKIICKIYCMRFMFTRLIAQNNNYDNNKILQKDPNEYVIKILYFNNIDNFGMNINYE
tara:strand:+ start:19072 stop:20052 length:981 start_codon:yes stop_codon:yes gene_type:complete